ncbi:MAG: squalene synthase HpnC [Acidimicrobiales bacterium]
MSENAPLETTAARVPGITPSVTVALPTEAEILAKAAGENFPVALRLLGRQTREHLLAIYGFARLVDDVGDELEGGPADRLAALDRVEAELDLVFARLPAQPLFHKLASAINKCQLPREPFAALIEANRQDQRVCRYATFEELLGYCRLSADPVGRLVLRVFRQQSPETDRLSDLVCSGLQLVEHFQDVVEDAAMGRVYLPEEDMDRFGVGIGDLVRSAAPESFKRLMAFQCARARELLLEGSQLVSLLRGRSRFAIAGFVAGGLAQIAAIEKAGYDVLAHDVKASDLSVARIAAGLLAKASRRAA